MKQVAKYVKSLDTWNGDARLYRLSTPLSGNRYVVVSAIDAMFSGPETYIFGCNKHGEDVDYGELQGSFKGSRNHVKALEGAGYTCDE